MGAHRATCSAGRTQSRCTAVIRMVNHIAWTPLRVGHVERLPHQLAREALSHRHPTTKRENTSSTIARYSHPSAVGIASATPSSLRIHEAEPMRYRARTRVPTMRLDLLRPWSAGFARPWFGAWPTKHLRNARGPWPQSADRSSCPQVHPRQFGRRACFFMRRFLGSPSISPGSKNDVVARSDCAKDGCQVASERASDDKRFQKGVRRRPCQRTYAESLSGRPWGSEQPLLGRKTLLPQPGLVCTVANIAERPPAALSPQRPPGYACGRGSRRSVSLFTTA